MIVSADRLTAVAVAVVVAVVVVVAVAVAVAAVVAVAVVVSILFQLQQLLIDQLVITFTMVMTNWFWAPQQDRNYQMNKQSTEKS